MRHPWKIDPGSVLTLQVTVENVWPDGRVTFRIGDYPAPVTVRPEYGCGESGEAA